MLQQAVAKTVRRDFRADADVEVVIHFDEAHAHLADQPVHHGVGMPPDDVRTEIQLQRRPFNDPPAMAAEEAFVGPLLDQWAVHAHAFQLKPQTGLEALGDHVVQHLLEPARETLRRWQPFAHRVPPGAVGIPAGVHDVVLHPQGRRPINQRHDFLGGRIGIQAIHVVVEKHRQLAIVGIVPANAPTIAIERAEGLVRPARNDCDGRRHGTKLFAWRELLEPLVLGLAWTGRPQIELAAMLADLPPPRPVVLYLPGITLACLAVLKTTQRRLLLGREAAGVAGQYPLHGKTRRAHLRHAEVRHAVRPPLQLFHPAVVGNVHPPTGAPGRRAGLAEAVQGKTRQELNRNVLAAAIA